MAKSSWKHVDNYCKNFILFFSELFREKFFKGKHGFYIPFKRFQINNLNNQYWYESYAGKYKRFFFTEISHINYSLGACLKTRKPFYFRSKKKKKNE